jgi:hypothetical protein
VWTAWNKVASRAAETPFGLLHEATDVAYNLADFTKASRAVLTQILHMGDAELFTSYSLRRSMPTLAEIRKAHPDDADALGDWTASSTSRMRTRYADAKEDSAAIVKLVQLLILQEAANDSKPLSWDNCRVLIHKVDQHAALTRALEMYAEDKTVHETPARFLKGLVAPKRRFNIAALPRRKTRKLPSTEAPRTPAPPASSQQAPVLPTLQTGESRPWVVVKYEGHPRVHLTQTEDPTPLCRRRRGDKWKPIKRCVTTGKGLGNLLLMHWGPGTVCKGCAVKLPADERNLLSSCL